MHHSRIGSNIAASCDADAALHSNRSTTSLQKQREPTFKRQKEVKVQEKEEQLMSGCQNIILPRYSLHMFKQAGTLHAPCKRHHICSQQIPREHITSLFSGKHELIPAQTHPEIVAEPQLHDPEERFVKKYPWKLRTRCGPDKHTTRIFMPIAAVCQQDQRAVQTACQKQKERDTHLHTDRCRVPARFRSGPNHRLHTTGT
jgi:hypothetical protein